MVSDISSLYYTDVWHQSVFVCVSSTGCPASAKQHMPLAHSCQCPLFPLRLLLCSNPTEAYCIWWKWSYLPLLGSIRVLANSLPLWDSSRSCQLHSRSVSDVATALWNSFWRDAWRWILFSGLPRIAWKTLLGGNLSYAFMNTFLIGNCFRRSILSLYLML